MRQAVIFTLLSCTLISAAPAVAEDRARAQAERQPPYDWVLVDGERDLMGGSADDLRRARAQKEGDAPLLYARRGERAWVFREASVLSRVRAAWAPVGEVGKRMEAVGERMREVGERQRAVGEKMRGVGTRMGKIGAELARLEHDDPRRQPLRDEMDALQRQMDPLQDEMTVIAREMDPLSGEMKRHGAEMKRLSAEAQLELARIIDDARARGLGREVLGR
jgi:bla regulator protein blaR1